MDIDNVDIKILAYLRDRNNYNKLRKKIKKNMCTKESWQLFDLYGKYFDANESVEIIDEPFKSWVRVLGAPKWKPETHLVYSNIIDNVLTEEVPESLSGELDLLATWSAVGEHLSSAAPSSETLGDVHQLITEYKSGRTEDLGEETRVYDHNLVDIINDHEDHDGYQWRLEDLNKGVGPIRKGDFIIVGKRPEVGGTSFLVSEMSHMIEQMPEDSTAVIFNNEEAPDKVYSRMVSSALGVPHLELASDPSRYQTEFENWLGTKKWHLYHDTGMSVSDIRDYLKTNKPGLIGVNVLLKVSGVAGKSNAEDHDKYQALGTEFRNLAQEYGPTFCIAQADPSAEGMEYIPQDRLYKSKTALQGEADVLIMIGKGFEDDEFTRHMHVAKNKIPPSSGTDPNKQHFKHPVAFDPYTGHFTTKVYK